MVTNINNNIESELSKININLREHIKDLALEWAVDKSGRLLRELNDEQQARIWKNRDGATNVIFCKPRKKTVYVDAYDKIITEEINIKTVFVDDANNKITSEKKEYEIGILSECFEECLKEVINTFTKCGMNPYAIQGKAK